MVVWKQKRSSSNNLLCRQMNCYSTCHINYKTNIPLRLRGVFGGSCRKCNHSLWNHHRRYAVWEKANDTQVLVDQNMKKRWEEAKDGKENTTAIVVAGQKAVSDLDQAINSAINNLAQLVERYARLSLSGNIAAPVNSTVRLLALEGKGVGPDQLQRVNESLDHMRRKLELLNSMRGNCQGSEAR